MLVSCKRLLHLQQRLTAEAPVLVTKISAVVVAIAEVTDRHTSTSAWTRVILGMTASPRICKHDRHITSY